MSDPLLQDLALAVIGSAVAAWVARRLGLPVIVAYLATGVLLGPHGLHWIATAARIERLAELGVGFLMFTLGVEVALTHLRTGWRSTLAAALVQVGGTILGTVIALGAAGMDWRTGVVVGCILALSSTALVLSLLEERGELDATHGRFLTGILVVQDLAVLPMVLLFPVLAGQVVPAQAGHLALGALFVVLALGMGPRLVAPLLGRVAALRSRETFFLVVLGLCLGLAWLAQLGGFSLAIGAFLAGLVVSEAPQSRQALAEVGPLRDLFAVVFFVSLGMLLEPAQVLAHWPAVLLLLSGIVLGKSLLGSVAAYMAGHPGRVALAVGLGLAQIGEFSFVLAGLAATSGLLGAEELAVILGASTISLMLAPFLLGLARPLGFALDRHFNQPWWWRARRAPSPSHPGLSEHVVIAGYGRMGQQVGSELRRWHVPLLAVDLDHARIEALRSQGQEAVYGDAARPEVLRACSLPAARLAIISLPDATSAELCLAEVRRVAPHLPVVVRAMDPAGVPRLHALGATEVILPAFEAGLEAIRRALGAYGFDPREVAIYLHKVRASRYVAFREDAPLDFGALPPLSSDGLDLRWFQVAPGAPVLEHAIQELEHPLASGVVFLAMRRAGHTLPVPPPRARLHPGDRVLVLGTAESLAHFARLADAPPGSLAPEPDSD